MSRLRIAVVGAGAGGLCVARHFVGSKLYEVVVFENCSQVGGTWAYREETSVDAGGQDVHSSMYANVRTNLSKEIMAFPDFPFAEDLPSFLTHGQVLEYLEGYSRHFDLLQHVKFCTKVVDIRPVLRSGTRGPENPDPGKPDPRCNKAAAVSTEDRSGEGASSDDVGPQWNVTFQTADEAGVEIGPGTSERRQAELFDAVFVCNGHYFLPSVPSIPGQQHFRGRLLHSHDYRRPDGFRDECVVVVGCGASGQDIGFDVATTARRVLVSAGRHRWMRSPLPANVAHRQRIERIDERGRVVFDDGTVEEEAHAILFCTGYSYSFPFLHGSCGVSVVRDRLVRPVYQHMVNATHPSMFFIGLPYLVSPFPLMDCQAVFAKAVLERRHRLPSGQEMVQWQDNDLEKRTSFGLPTRYGHVLASLQWGYNSKLTSFAGTKPLPPHYQALYDHIKEGRTFRIMAYRQENYRLRDDGRLFDVLTGGEDDGGDR